MINLLERAGWTFAQAFIAAFTVTDLGTLKVAALAGVGAALSVIKTYAVDRLAQR